MCDQHLVDDELEKERRRQREKLNEKRSGDDLRQRPAIAQERGQEPSEAEGVGIGAGAAETAGDENDLAGRQSRDLLDACLPDFLADRFDQP